LNLDIEDGIKLVELCDRKYKEEMLHKEWVGFMPHMKNQESFSDYISHRLPPQIDYENQIKSKDELMSDILGKE
jgi:hypothetical protein